MNKKLLALVDIDGVIANPKLRLEQASIVKEAFLEECRANPIVIKEGEEAPNRTQQATNLYWKTAFSSELVALDTPIEGIDEALLEIEQHGFQVIFFTSRPESMREATLEWLFRHTIYGSQHKLIMKAPAFQYTKTPIWKAGILQTIGLLYDADIVKFIDDEEANWNEFLKHTPYIHYSLEWIKSLKEFVEHLREDNEVKEVKKNL